MSEKKVKNTTDAQFSFDQVPLAAIVWVLISIVLLAIGTQTVTMQDQQKFNSDFAFTVEETDNDNTLILNLVSGTFRYNEVPEVITPLDSGTYTRDSDNLPSVASDIFDVLPSITDVTIEAQTITIV